MTLYDCAVLPGLGMTCPLQLRLLLEIKRQYELDSKKKTATSLPPGLPAGAQVLQLDLGDLEGGEIQGAIRKKLKEQGIEMGMLKFQALRELRRKK